MWKFKDSFIKSKEDIPEEYINSIGFIYTITQISTGKRYIGKKLLTKAATKMVKGKKKKIRKESDWIDYWSSSPQIKQWIEDAGGTEDFTKEILVFCEKKSELLYAEEYCLYITDSLLVEDFINSNIRSKVFREWFSKDSSFLDQIKLLKSNLLK